jgi:hypothetical protein
LCSHTILQGGGAMYSDFAKILLLILVVTY